MRKGVFNFMQAGIKFLGFKSQLVPLTHCVILGKLLNLSEPKLHICKTVPTLQGCCKDEMRGGELNTVASPTAMKLVGV